MKQFNNLIFVAITLFMLSEISFSQINVVFRIDDFGIDNSNIYPQLFNVFKMNNAKLVVGVVPFKYKNDKLIGLTEREKEILKLGLQEGVIEVAQHGFNHSNNAKSNESDSEFRGLSFFEQSWRIKSGKDYLENELGVSITTFIPPWNSFDSITVEVLRRNGFECISPSIMSKVTSSFNSFCFIPSTTNIRNFRQFIDSGNENVFSFGKVIVVLFHMYDLLENEPYNNNSYADNFRSAISMNCLIEMFNLLNKSDNIRTVTIKELLKENIDLSNKRYKYNLIESSPIPVPTFLKAKGSGAYLEINEKKNILHDNELISILFYILIFLLSIFISFHLRKHVRNNYFWIVIIASYFSLLFYGLMDKNLGYKELILVMVGLGYIVCVLLIYLTEKSLNHDKTGHNIEI